MSSSNLVSTAVSQEDIRLLTLLNGLPLKKTKKKRGRCATCCLKSTKCSFRCCHYAIKYRDVWCFLIFVFCILALVIYKWDKFMKWYRFLLDD